MYNNTLRENLNKILQKFTSSGMTFYGIKKNVFNERNEIHRMKKSPCRPIFFVVYEQTKDGPLSDGQNDVQDLCDHTKRNKLFLQMIF